MIEDLIAGIDWEAFFNMVLRGAIGATFSGLVAIGVYRATRGRDERKSIEALSDRDQIIDDLALLRTQGVAIRNKGHQPLEGDDRDEWIAEVSDWETLLYAKAAELTPATRERLATLDRFPLLQVAGVQDSEQLRVLSMLSETLQRLDRVLEQHPQDPQDS